MRKKTKELLMESGEILISKHGYYDTKVEDITKDAGVAKGTFYIYFDSKETIFMEIIQKKIEEHGNFVDNIMENNKEFKVRIEKLTEGFVKLMMNNLGLFRSFFKISQMDNGSMGEKIHEMMINNHNEMLKYITSFFSEAILQGEINKRYEKSVTELAIMYDTMRSEYIVRKLLNMSCSNNKRDCKIMLNKLDGINVSMEDVEIEKEAKFITDIFLGGIKN